MHATASTLSDCGPPLGYPHGYPHGAGFQPPVPTAAATPEGGYPHGAAGMGSASGSGSG